MRPVSAPPSTVCGCQNVSLLRVWTDPWAETCDWFRSFVHFLEVCTSGVSSAWEESDINEAELLPLDPVSEHVIADHGRKQYKN